MSVSVDLTCLLHVLSSTQHAETSGPEWRADTGVRENASRQRRPDTRPQVHKERLL